MKKMTSIIGVITWALLSNANAAVSSPVPATYIMVCCHGADKGTKFLANGEWDARHDYRDYAFALDQMRKIKEAGINVVGVDFTNPSQWDQFKAHHWPMLQNVVRAAKELDMQYFLFLGNTCAHTMKYWNEKAKIVWEEFAQDPHYRRYGFGDDRPMMTIFLPGKDFAAHLKRSRPEEKNWLEKFRIGTCQVNDPIVPTLTDGWGYRNKSAGSTDLARFVAPNSGVGPGTWARVDASEWRARVKWALGAKEYAVIGTYDDTCDCIFWGIADVRGSRNPTHVHESTKNDPYAYYNIVNEEIVKRRADAAPRFSVAKPVWPEGLEKQWNCQVGFTTEFDGRDAHVVSNAVLRFTGATMCRVFLNGEFLGYGPARAAHGFTRVEELPLIGKLKPGRNFVAIEVAGYNCDSFYTVRQPSFLQAEIVAGDKVIAATDAKGGAFKAGVLNYRMKKVPRLSFQRTFSEVYHAWPYDNDWRFGIRPPFVEPCTLAEQPQLPLLPRIVPVPDYAILPAKTLVATGTVKYDEKLPVKTPRSMTCTEGKDWRRDGWKVSELEEIPYYDMQRTVMVSRKEVGVASPSEMVIPDKSFALVDFGFLAAGFPKITVDCDGPGTLYFCFDEVLENGDISMKRLGSCCNIIKWRISEGGIYRLEAFEPYAFRYGKLIFFGNTCKVSELSIREYVNPEAGKAKFDSSDPDINKIFEAARRTFAENAVDGFMDCPSRERAGWNCDAFFTGRASIEFTGNAKEENIFIQNFLLPEKFPDIPDGMLPQCYPADFPDHSMIPNWAMWFVLELDEYYARTGDRAMVEAFRPRVMKLMEFFWKYRNEDGLLEKLPPSVFVEWSRSNALTRDVNYPTNMTWARVLDVVARLYGADATSASLSCNLHEEAERVRETVRRQSWNGTFFVDRALRQKDASLKPDTEATETCQYYAFFFGTATPESHPELWKRLVEDFGPKRKKNNKWPAVAFSNAFIGNYLRFECLSKAGLAAQILDEAKGYFSFMAECTGTLWEHDAPTASCSHGFASHIAHVLYRDVLGVRNIDRLKKTIELRFPDVPLEHCSGEIPLEDGVLEVSWRKVGDKLSYHHEAPKGYTVSVPNRQDPTRDPSNYQTIKLSDH